MTLVCFLISIPSDHTWTEEAGPHGQTTHSAFSGDHTWELEDSTSHFIFPKVLMTPHPNPELETFLVPFHLHVLPFSSLLYTSGG